jgi:signal transduction histidine kinase
VRLLRSWGRVGAGVALGAATAVAELGFLVLAGLVLLPVLPWRRPGRAVTRTLEAVARRGVRVEQWRLATFLSGVPAAGTSGRRMLGYLSVRWAVGLLGGAVLLLMLWGAVTAADVGWLWLRGERVDGIAPAPIYVTSFLLLGVVFLFLSLAGIAGVADLERRLARRMLGPSARELYEQRIAQLSTSRSEIVRVVDDERRRIERDLHDGVQQRLVALGMLLGRARRGRDPERVGALVRQAHEEAQRVLDDLREVAWRVYPVALDDGGLSAALETVAERASIPVRLRYEPAVRPPRDVETVAYFVVCEAVTNAAKHAGASLVTVHIDQQPGRLRVRVSDDGAGGADPQGSGLSGLARRVAALDGRFDVESPAGGPTSVTAELPCG